MKKITIVFTIFLIFVSYSYSLCQIESVDRFDPDKKDWEIYITFSTHGGGAGSKIKWGDRENLQQFLSFEISGVRGKNEYIYFDYWGYPHTIRTRYMVLIPMFFGFQKRIFKESIEENFRPFLDFEFGPVLGLRFPVGHGFTGNIRRGRTALTLGGFVGAGVEGGDITKSVFSFTLGYRFAYFFKKIVEVPDPDSNEQNFNAFVIRFGIVTQF